ncbi:DUF4145 domain-containing protein [Enterococcus faecium]
MSEPKSMLCPHCGITSLLINSTYAERITSFKSEDPMFSVRSNGIDIQKSEAYRDTIGIGFFRCPGCKKHTIEIFGVGAEVKDQHIRFQPKNGAKVFPDYIPKAIRTDYEEAYGILDLSPKASATISRRCLQGMIRDFWNISGKRNLKDEIDAIEDRVDPDVKLVLDSLRQLGNIGAHPEKDINLIVDIEPGEAKTLIKFIEYLFEEWYVKKQKTKEMMDTIKRINNDKQTLRQSKLSNTSE